MNLFYKPVLAVRFRGQEDEGGGQSIRGRFVTG